MLTQKGNEVNPGIWFDLNAELPQFEAPVMVSDGKELYAYASLEAIETGKAYTLLKWKFEWIHTEYKPFTPTHWLEVPEFKIH